MFTHTIVKQYRDSSGNIIGGTESATNNTEINFDDVVTAGTTDKECVWAITRANLKAVCLWADKAVTICTNAASTGAPQETIPLAANQAIIWNLATDLIGKCPFSADVTKLYISNAGASDANVKVRSLLDQTP